MQYFQKLIQKDLGFTHSLDTPIASHDPANIWALHHGKSKSTHDPSLVFHFDGSKPGATSSQAALAKSCLQRLKTLRHPDVLKYIASVEGPDGTIYVATEPATPLATILADASSPLEKETVLWGLYTTARALGFLHDSRLIHGRLNPATVFVTPQGDWKLAGFECVTAHSSAASLTQHAAQLQRHEYQSPEFARGNWSGIASGAPGAVDSWALGCLMYEAHAGSLTSPDQLQNISALPKQILSAYQKLLASNAANRAPAGQLPNHPYFQKSKFVELNMFVENLALKGQLEREAFLGKLPTIMDRLPDGFCTFKVLPMLSQSLETGAGASAAFACIVKMADRLSEHDFANIVVKKYAVGWYGNQSLDRNLKVQLYSKLDLFSKHFDDNALNTVLFPAMCASFQDMQAPALRDGAVKAVLSICNRLTDKNLNSVLMSHFARLQVDPEPAIRTNTTVCLGKLAPQLSPAARNKVLAAAFLRSLKDPFPHARAAGVNAILITTDTYSVKDIATRLLPAIIPLLIDKSGDVRQLAFKVVAEFQSSLTKNHEEMSRAEESSSANHAQSTEASGFKSGSASLGSGWGLSSFSSMTAALLNKSDTPAQSSRTSTGISSEDFKRGRPTAAVTSNGKPPAMAKAPTAMSSDTWGSTNGGGNAGSNVSAPPAFAPTPLTAQSLGGAMNTFSDFNDAGNELPEDDDDDGWGDMDIKPAAGTKPIDEEDLFVSMMGNPTSKPKAVPGGISRSGSNTSSASGSMAGGGDLWNLAPPMVSKPKPRPPTTRTTASGMGLNSTSSRRNKKSTGDDWEALLGGTGSTKRKPVSRGAR